MEKGFLNTKIKVVEVVPVLYTVEVPIVDHIRNTANRPAMFRDGATYEYGEVRNGHSRCSGAVVTVQIGTSADIEIDFTVNAISEETFTNWKTQARQYYSEAAWHYLNESYSGSARMGGFFAGSFGYFGASGNYSHYKNQHDTFTSTGTQESEGFLKSVHNLDNSTLHMKGRLRAYGVSYIPVSVSAFIEISIIKFADGKTLRAVSTNQPVAANPQNGSTTGVGSEDTTISIVS